VEANAKSQKIIFCVSCFLALLLFSAHEALLNFYPETLAVRNIIKICISMIPFFLSFFAWKKKKDALGLFLCLGLFACCLGDFFININFLLSVVIFLVGHIFFIRSFFFYKKPRAIHFVLWGLLYLAICLWIVFLSGVPKAKVIEGCVYSAFMIAMVCFSFCGPALLCAGGMTFGLSDILLMVNLSMGRTNGLPHVIALGVYYVAVFIMAAYVFFKLNPTVIDNQNDSI